MSKEDQRERLSLGFHSFRTSRHSRGLRRLWRCRIFPRASPSPGHRRLLRSLKLCQVLLWIFDIVHQVEMSTQRPKTGDGKVTLRTLKFECLVNRLEVRGELVLVFARIGALRTRIADTEVFGLDVHLDRAQVVTRPATLGALEHSFA